VLQLSPHIIMNSFRVARAAIRARPAAIRTVQQSRGYAEAVADKVISIPNPSLTGSSISICLPIQFANILVAIVAQAQLVPSPPGTIDTSAMPPNPSRAIPQSTRAGKANALLPQPSRPSTSRRMSSRSTCSPSLAPWVSSPTTFLRLSS